LRASPRHLRTSLKYLNISSRHLNTIICFLRTYPVKNRFSTAEMSIKTHLKQREIYDVAVFYAVLGYGFANLSEGEALNKKFFDDL